MPRRYKSSKQKTLAVCPLQWRHNFEAEIHRKNTETWNRWMQDRIAAGLPPIVPSLTTLPVLTQKPVAVLLTQEPVALLPTPFLTQALRWCGALLVILAIVASLYGKGAKHPGGSYAQHSTRVQFLK